MRPCRSGCRQAWQPLLDTEAEEDFNELLREIPTDKDLWRPTPATWARVAALMLYRRLNLQVGPVTATKLLASSPD